MIAEINAKDIMLKKEKQYMAKRTMPVCMTPAQYEKIAEIAKINGMVNASQVIEKILKEI